MARVPINTNPWGEQLNADLDLIEAKAQAALSGLNNKVDDSVTVAGKQLVGNVVLNKSDVGLPLVDNVSAANLRDRSTHTGTQSSASIVDFVEAVQDAVAAFLGVSGAGISKTYDDATDTLTLTVVGGGGTSTTPEDIQDVVGAAMLGVGNITVAYNDVANTITISTTATQNSTDAALRDRGTHTGTQTSSTISDLVEVIQDTVSSMMVSGGSLTWSYDDAAGKLTGTATGIDAEAMRDSLGTALIGSNGVTITPNDAADTILISLSNVPISVISGLQAALDLKVSIGGALTGTPSSPKIAVEAVGIENISPTLRSNMGQPIYNAGFAEESAFFQGKPSGWWLAWETGTGSTWGRDTLAPITDPASLKITTPGATNEAWISAQHTRVPVYSGDRWRLRGKVKGSRALSGTRSHITIVLGKVADSLYTVLPPDPNVTFIDIPVQLTTAAQAISKQVVIPSGYLFMGVYARAVAANDGSGYSIWFDDFSFEKITNNTPEWIYYNGTDWSVPADPDAHHIFESSSYLDAPPPFTVPAILSVLNDGDWWVPHKDSIYRSA